MEADLDPPRLRGGGPRPQGVVEGGHRERTACGSPPPPASLVPLPVNGEDFAVAASRLAGFAGVVLGWAPDVFWRATPDELASVVAVLAGDAPVPVDAQGVATLMEAFPDG